MEPAKIVTVLSNPALTTQEEVLPVVNEEIENFSKFLASQTDIRYGGPLNNMEKVLLRSYLVQKLRGKL